MKAFVVYESMFGNTHEIAEAIAEGLDSLGEVELGSVAHVAPEAVADAELLVIGGPTHMHGMSRPTSRSAAAEAAATDDELEMEPDATGPGLREWFSRMPKTGAGRLAAAFDTRLDKPALLTGSAAKGIAKQLRRHRYEALGEPESFLVEDSNGPLMEGERERARRWGAQLADRCRALDAAE
ncbi:MAG: flavodoxin domain-containing protein [Thermoleophilia bacterium]|nr:flavodoxin domain-containing protein [Thermoleophilia bacterium]MDH3724408.1 flavodoxin domain-containing protein [Thermoleophilia bacterium]